MRILVRAETQEQRNEAAEEGGGGEQQEIVGACDLESLQKLGEENNEYKNGFFLLVSQPSCGHCDTMRRVLDRSVKTLKPIVEASLNDKKCGELADALKVEITPTILYYEGKDEKHRIIPDGKITWQGVETQIADLARH